MELFRCRKVVKDVLRIRFISDIDHPRKIPFEMRIILVESLLNEDRVPVILGEDDRLTKNVSARNFLTPLHQCLKHLVNGIGIEEPLIQGCGIHRFGNSSFSSSHSIASHSSFSSSVRSSYLIPLAELELATSTGA